VTSLRSRGCPARRRTVGGKRRLPEALPIHAPPGPDEDELANRTRAIEVGQDMAVRTAIIVVVQLSGVGCMIEAVPGGGRAESRQVSQAGWRACQTRARSCWR